MSAAQPLRSHSVRTASAWPAAVELIARWLERKERADALLEKLPRELSGTERARSQNLVLGVIRHFGRVQATLDRLLATPPRAVTRAALLVAGYELIEAAADADLGRVAKIVHHAVELSKSLASPAEARLVNAVVRKLAGLLASPTPAADADADALAEYFSHPPWLVRSWLSQFGPDATRALLEWNQRPATVHARWRADPAVDVPPPWLKPTPWPGFFEVESGHWTDVEPLLQAGKIYLQDPSTRLPVELLQPKPGESILDLCAAPGGKSLLVADTMQQGRLVAVDAPGPRINRLKENLARAIGTEVALVQADVLKPLFPILREHRLPETYDGVLLDAPCSNTGVMRHRVDVKWRLQAGDFKKHPQQQLTLLHSAARLVAPGGRLVYSTCSIDTEENEAVIRLFLASRAAAQFTLEHSLISYPWISGHDGGGTFLLRRAGS